MKIIELKAYPTSFPVPPESSVTLGIGRDLFRDSLVGTPYTLGKDGCVRPLEQPGVGVEVDEEFKHPVIEGPSYV